MVRRTAAFEKVLDLAIANVTPPEFQKIHARIAKEALAEHLAKVNPDPQVERFVDGRQGAAEEQVKAYGVIRYEFVRLGQIVAEALKWLIEHSPKDTGEYRNSFYVGVNGKLIPAANFNAKAVPSDAEIVIGNKAPYHRKIDVQSIGGKKINVSVEPFLMERAAQMIRRRYLDVDCKRVYTMNFTGQYILKRGKRAGKPVQSPALILKRR
jgi:hypothetical protein